MERRKSWKPIAVYAVIFAAAAAIFPKPAVVADRTVLETLIDADQFTDKLNAMLDVFRDTTSGSQYRSNEDETLVYEVSADEPLRIKTATYSTYNYNTDSWGVENVDDVYGMKAESAPLNIGAPMGIAGGILEAATLDSDFAEKYGLTDLLKTDLTSLSSKRLSSTAFQDLSV